MDTETTVAAFPDHISELPQTSPDAEQTSSAIVVANINQISYT